MQHYHQFFINGQFVTPHGKETLDLFSPVDNQHVAQVTLGDETDTQRAVAAAKAAQKSFADSTPAQRAAYLQSFKRALEHRKSDLVEAMIEEYGGVRVFVEPLIEGAIADVQTMIDLLESYPFERRVGSSLVCLQPVGVVGVVIPWNASNLFICGKISAAIAAGCASVIKPSELSARQTQVMMECFAAADLPAGLVNVVNGLGNVVGNEITRHPDIAKITFTGSTNVGKTIARGAVESMKRVTLELGGKSPNVILDDADLAQVLPQAVGAAYMNSGQACVAATRLLVPQSKLAEVNAIVKATVEQAFQPGNPSDAKVMVGPAVSRSQYERVQEYIRIGIEDDGAELLTGGLGKPTGLEAGNFSKATVFTNVGNNMRIAQEEIFGPVLCIIPYQDEADAVAIANDTAYGLAAYVSSASRERALAVAAKLDAGQVKINNPFAHDNQAPFGGMKQSGIGREYGEFGISAYLEPKAIVG
ncbi:aldehyde dehydrogenase family protein [Testudinibacter sp. TR-2022]|nr:aldehyde dehydrogenase family protein [Pasteurellaceae bacterium Phil11]TNH29410.1 aldehyde dehydrogenase family protein [Testudinibacter sp. TR-2022]